MLEFLRNKKILIVVAHPDDELLGLGASMNLMINEYNINTHLVILGEGITSRSLVRDVDSWEKELAQHKNNIFEAQKCIGYQSVSTYNFPDNRFDSVALLDVIKVVEKEKNDFQPDVIFTHNGGDLNIDHRITYQAVITATRPIKGEVVRSIICFETPSGTEWVPSSEPYKFSPNFYIALKEENIEAKIKGMECYEFEKREFPHPRSPEALRIQAKKTGINIGENYAEAFQIIRIIS